MRIPFEMPCNRPFDVVGLGLNSIDLVTVLEEHPRSNSKYPIDTFAQLPGGQIATAMTICARLGWTTKYIGSFGDDEFGRLSRESLLREGVDISQSRTIAGSTNQFAIVLVEKRTGNRTVLWNRDPKLTIDPASVPREAVTSGRMLLVDCYDTAAAMVAARYAREAGIPTVIDVEKVRPGIADLLHSIDAIIAAEDFPMELTGASDMGRALEVTAREFGASVVCVTLGAQGSLARCAGREIRTPAFPVACVDTTGAGDAFRAGFVAGCLRQKEGEIEDVLAYANAVAALNCRALGARGGAPTAKEVEQLLVR